MLPFSVSREFLVFFVPLLLTCSVFAGNRGVVPQRKKDDTDSSPWELGGTYYKHARTKITTTQDAANYLWEYGYMTERDIRRFESLSDSEATRFVNSKLMRFQTMGNIRAKGSLDRNTIALMNQPRCGNKDTERPIRNNIPLKLSCIREKAVVTYAVMSYTRDLPQHTVQTEIARAFEEWSDVISITFEETNGTSDIEINFVDGFHTYSPMFDGAGGTVAKAMFDLTGQGGECGTIYIDEGELWTKQSPRGLDLYTVMVHEIGHLIGLTHSADPDSIMWPWFDTKTTLEDLKARRRQKLDVVIDSDRRHPAASVKQMAARQHTASAQRDEVAAQPENDVQNTESHKWTENNSVLQTNILNVGRGPELLNGVTVCPSAIDAITVAANGKTYAFKDGNVYMLNKSTFGIEDGFPSPIASVFGDNAPGRVDAAVTLYYYGVPFTYLFQDRQYWRYREGFHGEIYADKGYPRSIVQGWALHIPHLDAVVEWERKSFLLFFQGDNIYGHDGKDPIEKGKPRHMNDFPQFRSLPKQRLRAAMRWDNHRTYFFYEDKYYVWSRAVYGQARMAGPFSIEYDFFNCQVPLIGSGAIN